MVLTTSKNYFRTPRFLMNLFERSQEIVVEKTFQGRIKDFFVKKMCFQLLHVYKLSVESLRNGEDKITGVRFPTTQDCPSLNVRINGWQGSDNQPILQSQTNGSLYLKRDVPWAKRIHPRCHSFLYPHLFLPIYSQEMFLKSNTTVIFFSTPS